MIQLPMKSARRHAEISLTKNDREPLKTHFKECTFVFRKQETLQRDRIKNKKSRIPLSVSNMVVLNKVIANSAFYQLLIKKLGENYARSSLNYLRYNTFEKGEFILKEGDQSKKTFYILEGTVRYWKSGIEFEPKLGEIPSGWEDALPGSQNELIIGNSFGYLPDQKEESQYSYQVSSKTVGLAYIDQFGIGFIDKDIFNITTKEKYDFFLSKFPKVFDKIAKPAALLFVPLIKEVLLQNQDVVAEKFPQNERSVCALSKGQLTVKINFQEIIDHQFDFQRQTEISIERERLQDDGIELKEVKELKIRQIDSKVIYSGSVFLVGAEDSNMNQSTHLRVSQKVISSNRDTRLYHYKDDKYDDILDDLRYQMRYDAFVNTDNLRVSAKVFEDFIKIRSQFLHAMNDELLLHQRIQNPAPPPSSGKKITTSVGGIKIYTPSKVYNPSLAYFDYIMSKNEPIIQIEKSPKRRVKTCSSEKSKFNAKNSCMNSSYASTAATVAKNSSQSRQNTQQSRQHTISNWQISQMSKKQSYPTLQTISCMSGIKVKTQNEKDNEDGLEEMIQFKWTKLLNKSITQKKSFQSDILKIFDGVNVQNLQNSMHKSKEETTRSQFFIDNFSNLPTETDYYLPKKQKSQHCLSRVLTQNSILK